MLRSACFTDVRSSKYVAVSDSCKNVLLLPHLSGVSYEGKEQFLPFSNPRAEEVLLVVWIS